MKNPLTVLLVEDEPLECQEMIRHIEASSNTLQLVGVTNNTMKALQYATDSLPEAIILDLELHKGQGNGLNFLASLRELRLSVPIYVLVTTNNISTITHESARKLGADFIMVKSQEDYSAKEVVAFLSSLKNIIQSNRKTVAQPGIDESPEQKRQRMQRRIAIELDRIGISPNAVGRKYLIDCISLIATDQNARIRSILSEKYARTEASIERAMQNAIEKAWKTADINDLVTFYTARIRSNKGVPTVMEFIYYYAEKIRNEY